MGFCPPVRPRARAADARRRAERAAVAVVDIVQLMRDLATYMPHYDSEAERRAYLDAVKDIAIQVNGALMYHEHDTGELRLGGPPISIAPDPVVAEALEVRRGEDGVGAPPR